MFWERRFPVVGNGSFVWAKARPSQRERASEGAGRPGAAFPLFSPCSFLLPLSFFFLPVTRSVPRGLATLRQRLSALEE